MNRHVLVILAGECDEAPGSKEVVAAVEVADRDEALRVKATLGPGEIAHWVTVTPASDYL